MLGPVLRPDPYRVLGLAPDATADQVHAARRRLAKAAHPDVGGSAHAMQHINDAAREALNAIAAASAPNATPPNVSAARDIRRVVDHPSFVIEAVSSVAFDGLALAVSGLGTVVDQEPLVRLEARLDDPIIGWLRLGLTPEAGRTTVSIDYQPMAGYPAHSVEDVRDAVIGELNQLDWNELTH